MSNFRDLNGLTINFLTIIERAPNSEKRGGAFWKCLCKCGVEKVIRSEHIRSGAIKSCGCLKNSENQKRNIFDHNFRILQFGLCWEWRSYRDGEGYAIFYSGESARKYSYETFNGEVQNDEYVCLKCNNRGCVNPNHLYLKKME